VETAKHINIQAVVDAFMQEPYWGARCEFADALGDANHATAIEGIAQLIRTENEPRVMISLLAAAANYRSPAINSAVQSRLQTTLGPESLRTAFIVLGKQREQAPLDILISAARPSRDSRAQAGAFLGLGESRHVEVIPLLLTYATYGGSPNRARPSAASALALLGKNLDKDLRGPVLEKLTDLLRDPWYAVTWAAARALASLGDASAIPALETFGRSLSAQDQATVDRMIEDLRSKDKVDGSAQQKQIDELRDKVRTLEGQLQSWTARLEDRAEVD
jgi:HEAT repeat protein